MKIILLNSEEREKSIWLKYLLYQIKSRIYWSIVDEDNFIDHLKKIREVREMLQEEFSFTLCSPYTGEDEFDAIDSVRLLFGA